MVNRVNIGSTNALFGDHLSSASAKLPADTTLSQTPHYHLTTLTFLLHVNIVLCRGWYVLFLIYSHFVSSGLHEGREVKRRLRKARLKNVVPENHLWLYPIIKIGILTNWYKLMFRYFYSILLPDVWRPSTLYFEWKPA